MYNPTFEKRTPLYNQDTVYIIMQSDGTEFSLEFVHYS